MLTATEQRVLDAFRAHLDRHGQPPLLRELGAALGIASKGTLHRYVRALIAKGCLRPGPGGWRGSAAHPWVFPLPGRIAAGSPLEAIPGLDELDLAAHLGGDVFVLQVAGESMSGIGINEGDYVFIRRQDTAADGAIVVALIDGADATLKRLRRRPNGQIQLLAENPTLAPMTYAAGRVTIQGVLIAKLRLYGRP